MMAIFLMMISIVALLLLLLSTAAVPIVTTTKVISTTAPVSSNKDVLLTSLVEQAVTFTCTINLDQRNLSTSGDYKILWSKETTAEAANADDDYEPLFLDDTPLVQDSRMYANRVVSVNKAGGSQQQIQWNLFIYNLKLNDSNFYICQLNVQSHDSYWLKRFRLEVYAPSTFIDDEYHDDNQLVEHQHQQDHESSTSAETSLYVKTVREYENFKLKCLATGKPTPVVSWHIKYSNGSTALLSTNSSEILIKNIKRSSKIDRIECLASNGVGASASRSFKINLLYSPHMLSKTKENKTVYRVPIRTNDFKLNCTVASNPISKIYWLFLSNASNNENTIKITSTNWTVLESTNPRHLSMNSDSVLYRLPLSRHQIYEKTIHPHLITSILYIRHIDEADFGVYRCLAVNSIANQTLDFHVDELKHELFNHNRLYKSNKSNETLTNKKTHQYKYENHIDPQHQDTSGNDEDDDEFNETLNDKENLIYHKNNNFASLAPNLHHSSSSSSAFFLLFFVFLNSIIFL